MDVKQALAMPNRGAIEQWARAGAQSQYLGTMGVMGDRLHIVLCRVLYKYLMVVSAEDLSVSPHLMFNGMWEPWVTMAIAKHIQPGMCCVDIGAQQGYYTIMMADLVGDKGHVLAFEPQEWATMCMERSLDANGLRPRVTMFPLALSDVPGAAKLYTHPWLHGGASLQKLSGLGKPDDVDVTTLDAALAEPGRPEHIGDPDFVKIDVERLEANVMLGMAELIERKRKLTICVEVTGAASELAAKYAELGFEVGTVGYEGHVRPFDPKRDERQDDEWQMLWFERK